MINVLLLLFGMIIGFIGRKYFWQFLGVFAAIIGAMCDTIVEYSDKETE